ncbi:MAG TPA: hypothetical protein VLH36_02935 [Steroidobacteraceae bacterium]|nr:hypothetical protein [Steroidobacteraceae bacterium]
MHLHRSGVPTGDELYLLVRGRLHVWIGGSEPGAAGPRCVAEVGPGEIVGEIGMLSGGVKARVAVITLRLP